MTVADRIKHLRESLGMTQDELAEKMGYDGKSSVSKMENSGDNVTLKKIARVAPCLHTTTAYLMGWVSDPDPDYLETKTGKLEMLISKDAQDAEAEIQRQVNRGLAQASLNMDEVTKAMDLFHQYEKASPEIQSAIETLLKAAQSES